MSETAGILEARLGLLERVRRMEHVLARGEQARVASNMMKGLSHELGNQVQIVKLSALELERRIGESVEGTRELVHDMAAAADAASGVLMSMLAATRPVTHDTAGPAFAGALRSAVELARAAVVAPVELRIDLGESVSTYLSADELDVLVAAAVLDAASASRITLLVRERTIQNKRWVELLRIDDRPHLADGDLAQMFEPPALLHVVPGVARLAGGDASIAPGRTGLELAVELPVAKAP